MTNEKSRGKVFREIYASVVFIWKLLRVTAAIGTKAAKLWGVQQHLSSNPLCQAEELWGAGSLARDGGLLACVALPQRHWCLLMFPRSCTKNPARLFSLSLKLLNTAHPQVVARPSGSPAREAFFFLIQPTQTHRYCFHVWLRGLLDCSSCRELKDTELKDGQDSGQEPSSL